MTPTSLNRREFARLFALGGSAALLAHPRIREQIISPLEGAAPSPGVLRPGARGIGSAPDWNAVRARFLIPEELSVMNAANLCPAPREVVQGVHDATWQMDSVPVPSFRNEIFGAKEEVRDRVAAHLRATPEEILLVRNTSEANNWVSAGLDLGPGDEVVVFSDNHRSNHQAWYARGERHGFTVREVAQVNPHPGDAYYLDAFARAMNSRTRVLAFSHLSNTVGDLLPAEAICALARERGVATLVDGAQTFGLLDVDLSRMDPDFYTGSAHKWPCGPKECGVLFVNRRMHEQFAPSIYSAYPGRRGISRTHEGLGQRDEPAVRVFGAGIDFLGEIGQGEIEARSRALTDAAVEGLSALDGVHLWTSPDPALRVAVVSFQPGSLEPARVLAALEEDGVVAASRGGTDRPGIRFSPHFYNSFEDVERGVDAISRYLRTGL